VVKRLVAIVLSLVFLAVFSGSSLIVLQYNLNKKQIIERYCVNKDKPEMCCEGKCYLQNQLKQKDKRESNTPFSNIRENFELSFFIIQSQIIVHLYCQFSDSNFFFFPVKQTIKALTEIFHPPC